MQSHEITNPQILPALLNPQRPIRILPMRPSKMRQMRAMKMRPRLLLLVRLPGRVDRTVRVCVPGVVGVEVAVEAEMARGEGSFVRDAAGGVGAAAGCGGGRGGRGFAPAGGGGFLPCALKGSATGSGTGDLGTSVPTTPVCKNLLLIWLGRRLAKRDTLLPLPLLLARRAELLRSPEALLLPYLTLLGFVLGVADELATEEEVTDEGGKTEGTGLVEGEVGVVVGAAEGEDLWREEGELGRGGERKGGRRTLMLLIARSL